jgi:hypothetical protein
MNVSTSIVNNWISCSFSRLISDSLVPGYLNLTNQYYVLGAIGLYSGSTPQKHSMKSFSSSLVDFSKTLSTSSSSRKYYSKLIFFGYIIAFLSI